MSLLGWIGVGLFVATVGFGVYYFWGGRTVYSRKGIDE